MNQSSRWGRVHAALLRETGATATFLSVAVAAFLLGTGAIVAHAETAVEPFGVQVAPGDTLRVSLHACIDRAIEVGEEVQIAEADLASARGLYEQVRADVLPQLTFSVNYVHQFESIYSQEGVDFGIEPFVPDTLATLEQRVRDLENALPTAPLASLSGLFSAGPFASEHRWDAGLALHQKIFEGWGLQAAVRVARHGLRSFEERLADRETEVRMLVREVYLGALLADRTVEIAELGLTQAQTQLQRVQARYDAGEAAEFDLLQAEVQRDNQYPVVKDANNTRAIAYLRLAGIANLPVTAVIVLTTPLLDLAGLPPDPFAVLDTTRIVESALRNAGLVALEEEMTARQLAVTAAGRTAWPALSVYALYSKQAFPSDLWPARSDWRTDASAGLSMTWDIFDGLRTRGSVNETRADYIRTTQTLQQERETVQLRVALEIGELGRAAEDLRSRTRTVQVAQRALDLATLRYEEGASSLLEVEDARVAFQVSQLSEARARHDYYLALARLERYSSQPLFTSLVQQMGGESQ